MLPSPYSPVGISRHEQTLGPFRRRRRWWLAALAALLILPLGGYAGVSLYAANTLATSGAHKALTATASSIGSNWEDVSFPSRIDKITLRGWLFRAFPSNGRSAILLHGMLTNRTDRGSDEPSLTRAFIGAGYDTLVFDFRSFGLSDGNGFTLGWREGRDVLGAFDFMKARRYDPHRMVILGISMGAESMLGVASQLGDAGALISDSAYADLRPALNHEITKYSHLPGIFNPGIILAFQLFHDGNPDFRPADTVRALPGRAFLFLHGGGDTGISPSNAFSLKAASANSNSALVVFPGSEHSKEFIDYPQRYLSVVFSFIDQQLSARR